MKILIVDDNAEIRRLIKSLLSEIADEIDECEDGFEAVQVFETKRFDWILMDVFMKKMDGIAATEKIKNIAPSAKIAIVTNHTDKRTRQAAVEAGADAFFGKDDLLSLVLFLSKRGF